MTTVRKERLLGPWMSMAMVVGYMIGSGIFLLPATLAPFGRNAVIAWAVTIFGTLSLALAFARLSAHMKGGPYAYIERAFGEKAAYLTMWAYLVSNWSAAAAIAVAAAGATARAFPALGGDRLVAPLAIGYMAALVLVALRGARSTGWAQLATTALKLIPLAAVVGIVLFHFASAQPVHPLAPMPVSPAAVAAAGALMFFSLTGFEAATVSADKTLNAERTVPIATLGGTAITGAIYFTAWLAVMFLLGPTIAAASASPFADALAPSWGENAARVIAVFIAISAIGALNAQTMINGEVGFALGRDGSVPRVLARINHNGAPHIAIIVSAVIAALLVAANSSRTLAGLFAFMILISTVSVLVLYAAGALAALRLPLGRVTKLLIMLGLPYAAWTFYGAGLEACLWGLALLAAGWPVRLISQWVNSRGASRVAADARAAPPGSAA